MITSRIRLVSVAALRTATEPTLRCRPSAFELRKINKRTFVAEAEAKKEEDETKTKKEVDSNKDLSHKLLDKDAKIDKLSTLILETPEKNFNSINTAVGLYRYGRLLSNDKDSTQWDRTAAVKKLLRVAMVQSFDPRSCANMCFGAAVARLDMLDDKLAGEFLAHIARDQSPQIPKYNPKQLTVMGWSFAMLQSKEDAYLKALFSEASSRPMKEFDLEDVPKLMWAMGRSQIKDAHLIAQATKHLATADLSTMDHKDISGLAWGLGKLGLKEEAVLKRIIDEVMDKRGGIEAAGFSLQSMARLLFGLAALPYKDDRLIKSALEMTARRGRYLRPQSRKDLTFAMWTFGAKEFEEQLAKIDGEVEARKQKALKEKAKFIKKLEERAVVLADMRKQKQHAGSSKASPA